MTTEIKEFSSLSEFMKYVDEKLSEYRRMLGELLRVLEDIRVRAEQSSKLRSLLARLQTAGGGGGAGGEATAVQPAAVIDLKGFKVAFNPTAEVELELLEQLVESINDKISRLQTIRKELEALSGEDIEATIKAVIVDDVPRALMIKV